MHLRLAPTGTALWPTDRLLAVVAACLVPAAVPAVVGGGWWPVWFAVAVAVALLAIVDWWLAPPPRAVSVEVELPPALEVGDPAPVRVSAEASSGRFGSASIRLEADEYLGFPSVAAFPVSGSTATLEVVGRPSRRGMLRVEAVWLRYSGPLGLLRRSCRLPVANRIEVRPSLRLLRGTALASPAMRDLEMGARLERLEGGGSEFRALREFVPGLDVRAIDWKASARHLRLMCREYRAERNRQVVLAVDTGRLMCEEVVGIPRLDHAIQAGLLLGWMGLRAGDRVGMFSFAARPGAFVGPRGGTSTFPQLVGLASRLTYNDEETNFTLGLLNLAGRLRRRSLVVVLTDFVDSVTAELTVDNVLRLAGHHLVLFVALRDPVLDRMVDTAPSTVRDLDASVVADSLLREREVVVRRLQRAGVHCVDAVPEQVGPDLLNRYLEIKRRELI